MVGGQRASVEAARAAGVNLAFFSGNEMYWKTRWEPSMDGANTPYRTLVSYKDTLAGRSSIRCRASWTGTWRDTRFSPPVADGGRPENSLIGQIWTVNARRRSASRPRCAPALLAEHAGRGADSRRAPRSATDTLGYEWDEDLDNGARPAGLMHLSSTTVDGVPKILGFGEAVGTGTATHT